MPAHEIIEGHHCRFFSHFSTFKKKEVEMHKFNINYENDIKIEMSRSANKKPRDIKINVDILQKIIKIFNCKVPGHITCPEKMSLCLFDSTNIVRTSAESTILGNFDVKMINICIIFLMIIDEFKSKASQVN